MSNPVLITGVGRRVGLHLAQNFLNRDIPVVGTYRSERPELEKLRDQGADLFYCDFYDEPQITALVNRIVSAYSGLRAIIHNASDWLPDRNEVGPAETIRRMMQVHASAPYQLNLGLAPLLQSSSTGRADIIHIGDYVSGRGSKKHIAYAASKAAQDNLTLSFAASLAPAVKVNSIAPALVLFNEGDDAAYREKALSKSLLQREGGLEEMQDTVDFLLNSGYITGRIIPFDGGRHLA
ncbi:MAG: dihydromonapterin reductase [Xanthomonadales bacterium]|nr:dihydromonapterin reductase [Gammaproteobacteria bacterium]MBT8053742.1 dihydromonapterin reductase [Gammaproteobacteria bacterium]NND57647.1 dihydromonapterin reductase [Xanthomonadales bacterium]NNK51579.1 dihydromonapterin reductase [Xanthomonadales bacterium]